MNRKKITLIICGAVLLAAALAAGIFFFFRNSISGETTETGRTEEVFVPEPVKDCLTLYVSKDCPLINSLSERIEEYNSLSGVETGRVEMTIYETEDLMAAYMDSARPDMFICGYGTAESLADEEKLSGFRGTYEVPLYKHALADRDKRIGACIFPLGAETDILVVRNGTFKEYPKTFMELFNRCSEKSLDSEKPSIYVSDFTSLFSRAVKERGDSFRYDVTDNSTGFNDICNCICSTAYVGGIAFGDISPVDVLRRDNVSCAVVPSTVLKTEVMTGYDIAEVPQAGSIKTVSGILYCLVMSDRADAVKCSKFISWLGSPDRLEETALSSGLVPVITVADNTEEKNGNPADNVSVQTYGTTADRLSAILRNIADTSSFSPENERKFSSDIRNTFETEFRKELQNIN